MVKLHAGSRQILAPSALGFGLAHFYERGLCASTFIREVVRGNSDAGGGCRRDHRDARRWGRADGWREGVQRSTCRARDRVPSGAAPLWCWPHRICLACDQLASFGTRGLRSTGTPGACPCRGRLYRWGTIAPAFLVCLARKNTTLARGVACRARMRRDQRAPQVKNPSA